MAEKIVEGTKLLIVTSGSRGDIQPFLACGLELLKAGFKVSIVTGPEHRELVKSVPGIDYYNNGCSFQDFFIGEAVEKIFASGQFWTYGEALGAWRAQTCGPEMTAILKQIDAVKPDLLITAGPMHEEMSCWVPRVLRIPCLQTMLMPMHGCSSKKPLFWLPDHESGDNKNWVPTFLMGRAPWISKFYGKAVEEHTGKPMKDWAPAALDWAISFGVGDPESVAAAPPMLVMCFEEFSKDETDPPSMIYTGYPTMPEKIEKNYEWGGEDTEKLEAFLGSGDPPVYIGYGSMKCMAADKLTTTVVKALKLAEQRGVVLAGWGGLDPSLLSDDDLKEYANKNVMFIKAAQHGALFPRCAVLVHHAGHGTTFTALNSGVPSIITPIHLDQLDNGALIMKAGAGTMLNHLSAVTAEELGEAIKKVLGDDNMKAKAKEAATLLAGKNGAKNFADEAVKFTKEWVFTGKFMEKVDSGIWVQKPPPKTIRFPEGGVLDRLDKACSRPCFHMTLPSVFETLLTMPGSWFGCPLYALGLAPVVAAACAQQDEQFMYLSAPTVTAGVGYWLYLCRASLSIGWGIVNAYTLIGKNSFMLFPHAIMAMLSACSSSEGTEIAGHYMSSWFCTQLLIEALKGMVWRLRPTAALADELDKVPRKIKELASVVKIPSQANLSFPSGDAAGSAIFATSVSLAAPSSMTAAVSVAVLSGFGRMYFHCHHLLDVLVGQMIGCGVTLALDRFKQRPWRSVLISELLLIALWGRVQKLKPADAHKQEFDPKTLSPEEDKSEKTFTRFGPFGLDYPAETYVPHSLEEHEVCIDDIMMNYVVAGDLDGIPLLLIPAQAHSWWAYEQCIKLLTGTKDFGNFRVYAVDLRGQGRSSRTPGQYTFNIIGQDLVRFCQEVVLKQRRKCSLPGEIFVSGCSSGGVLAAWLAANAPPGMVRGIVCEDPALLIGEITPEVGLGILCNLGIKSHFGNMNKYLGNQWSRGDYQGLSRGSRSEVPQNLKEYDPEWAHATITGRFSENCNQSELLRTVKCPVRVTYHGGGHLNREHWSHIGKCLEASGQYTEGYLPEKARHEMHLHEPERFVRMITEFFQKCMDVEKWHVKPERIDNNFQSQLVSPTWQPAR